MANAKVDMSKFSKSFKKEVTTNARNKNKDALCVYLDMKLKEAYSKSGYADQTYNLADSYLWIVYENGQLYKQGFLNDSPKATRQSVNITKTLSVNGRKVASDFIASYTPSTSKGLEGIIVVPVVYGKYLQSGSYADGLDKLGIPNGRRTFKVISHVFDGIKKAFDGIGQVTTFTI